MSGPQPLQIPIVVAGRGRADAAGDLGGGCPTDKPETLVLARRLADHAGLALEHAERRRAQEAAARSAHDTQRLLNATEALGAATTPELVGAAALEEAHTTLGAAAGAFLRLSGDELVLLARPATPRRRSRAGSGSIAARAPLAEAVTQERAARAPDARGAGRRLPEIAAATRYGAWLSIPLSVGGNAIGAVGLSFAEGRTFRPADLEYVDSLARQAGLALDRTLLLEDEQRARVRAEQLAGDLSRLHAFATSLGAATSTSEIGTLLCEQVKSCSGRARARSTSPNGGDRFQLLHGSSAADREASSDARRALAALLDAALNPSGSLWLATEDDWRSSRALRGAPNDRRARGRRRPARRRWSADRDARRLVLDGASSPRTAGSGCSRRWCVRRRSRSSASGSSRASGRRGSTRRPPRSARARCTRWPTG